MIQAGLVNYLTSQIAGVTAYGMHVAANATLPAITTEMQGSDRQRTHGAAGTPTVDMVENDFQVTVWANTYYQASKIGEQVLNALESYRGIFTDQSSPQVQHRVGDIQVFDEDQNYNEEYARYGYVLFLTISYANL